MFFKFSDIPNNGLPDTFISVNRPRAVSKTRNVSSIRVKRSYVILTILLTSVFVRVTYVRGRGAMFRARINIKGPPPSGRVRNVCVGGSIFCVSKKRNSG